MRPDEMQAVHIDREPMIVELRNGTPLSRLNHSECHAVFDRLAELGYTVTKPAPVDPANG